MTARQLTIKGVSASPGLASGPLVVLAPQPRRSAESAGTPEQESARLGEAIEAAIGDLAIILEKTEDEAASGMLEFQIAMLADDSLSGPAYRDIANGRSAAKAWGASLDTEIADYQTAEDAYFRARAIDLEDLRDRVLQHLLGGQERTLPAGSIVLAEELTPSRFLEHRTGIAGIALHRGSSSSHVAILARAQGTPMLIRLGPGNPEPGAEALLDATAGELTVNPDAQRRERFRVREVAARREWEAEESHLHEDAVLPGGERVQGLVNVANPQELAELDPSTCDGIGLVRTEFLFDEQRSGLPGEEEQLQIYRRVFDWAAGRPVTFRTLDAGADKPISGLTLDGESNPFLGVRGLRLSLRRPDVFKGQLRALIRAAVERGPLKVMLPMVTEPSELDQARELIRASSMTRGNAAASTLPRVVGSLSHVAVCLQTPWSAWQEDIGPLDVATETNRPDQH